MAVLSQSLIVDGCDPLELLCLNKVQVDLRCLRIGRLSIILRGMVVIDKAKFDSLSQPLRLLLGQYKLAGGRVFLDTEGGVSDLIDVRGDARHHKVVQMVV